MSSDDRPPRPDPLCVEPDAIPETLTQRDAWVCWRYKFDTDRDEWTKVPFDADTGGYASATDPDTWVPFAAALAYHERAGTDTDGVGVVVHNDDTVCGLDLDHCRDPDTGDRNPWADDVLDNVPTYTEVSPSGTGLRLFGFGFVPDGGTSSGVGDGDADDKLEMYDSKRYLTVTGQHVDGTPEGVRQVHDEIGDVHAAYIADDEPDRDTPNPAGDGGVQADAPAATPGVDADTPGGSDAAGDLSDDALLNKAKNAENGAKFRRLWNGDTAGYPSHSEADLALCSLLAFWTDGNHQRIDRLFRQSGLCRDKWTDRKDYRQWTIDTALDGAGEYYDPAPEQNDTAPDVTAVWAAHKDSIEAAEMPVERLDACEPLFREMARADRAGDDVDVWIDQLAAIDRMMTKTAIRKQYESVRDDLAPADDGPDPLDQWLRAAIERVVVKHVRGSDGATRYVWELTDDVAADLRADHFTTIGTAHKKWQNLDDAIFETLGVEVAQPTGERAGHGEFSQWIKSFINDRRVDKEADGARIQAIEWLKDTVRTSVATPSLERAARRSYVWMPAPDADELAVKSAEIDSLITRYSIDYAGLHHELDLHGYLAGGSKVHRRDNGREIRMWHLSTDLAEPKGFEPADDADADADDTA